ncbi:MAG: complex I NDUFA9 subunit family protein [Pedosphaera parvula]|nr:complex I NDUFA9 subunit family protein [Pedosphaera parvula]
MTGATGFVGRHILKKLMEQGHTVKCLVRPDSAPRLPQSPQVMAIPGNIHDPSTFESALGGSDGVIHLVGIISEVGENTFYRVHTRGAMNLVDAMCRQGVRRLVHMSALGTRPGANSQYHQSKYDAEVYLCSHFLDFTVFRPSVIHGPDGEFTQLLKQFATLPFFPVLGDGKGLLQPVYVEDVATVFVSALTKPESVGRVYPLGGPKAYTIEAMVEVMARAMGRSPGRPMHIPLWLMNLQAAAMETIFPVLGQAPILNTDQLVMAQEDNVCDSSEAQTLFGTPFVDFEEAVRRYMSRVSS